MSNSTPDFSSSQSSQTQQHSPEEFRVTTQDVNPISSEEDSSQTAKASASEQPEGQTELVEKVIAPFSEILSTLRQVWAENRRLLVILGLALALLPLLGVVVSLLVVIHSIPFLSFFLKLIGLGYSFWFVSQYFLLETKRQKLLDLWQKILEAARSQPELK